MINNELLEYIKHQRQIGISRETISGNLKSTGWNDADINEAFVAITPVPVSTGTFTPIPPIISNVTPNIVQTPI